MLSQMRRWSRLSLSYAARVYTLNAYVWSKGRAVGAYVSPPPTKLKMLTAASKQFIWKGRISNGTTTSSTAGEFRSGSRPVATLVEKHQHAGMGWLLPPVQLDAQHAMWVIKLMEPRRANKDAVEWAWYDLVVTHLRRALGVPPALDAELATVVREKLAHGHDLSHRVRLAHRRGRLSALWRDAVVAWDVLRTRHVPLGGYGLQSSLSLWSESTEPHATEQWKTGRRQSR
jgi:hypothetical protein